MSNLLSHNQAALKMLFTEDIYFIRESVSMPVAQPEVIAEVKMATPLKPVEESPKPEVKTSAQTDFEYLGENNKYFLVLIDDKIHTRINPVHQEMLLKVMSAKKLELRDLAILNISRYPDLKFNALKTFFSCSRMLMFGVSPADIGIPPVKANTIGSAGTVKVLATYSLEEMRNDADKKREFWNVMKNF